MATPRYPKQAWLSTKKPSNNYNSQEDPWYLGLPDWNQGAPKFDGLCVYPRYDHFPHFNRYILCLSSPGRSQLRHPFSSSRSRACQGLQHCDRPNNLRPMGHKLQDPISHQQHRNIRTSIVIIVYFKFVTYVWYYTFVLCLILLGGILDLIHFHTRHLRLQTPKPRVTAAMEPTCNFSARKKKVLKQGPQLGPQHAATTCQRSVPSSRQILKFKFCTNGRLAKKNVSQSMHFPTAKGSWHHPLNPQTSSSACSACCQGQLVSLYNYGLHMPHASRETMIYPNFGGFKPEKMWSPFSCSLDRVNYWMSSFWGSVSECLLWSRDRFERFGLVGWNHWQKRPSKIC